MKIAVLSGKGGTGKTFVSVNLAVAAGKATYIDCDVEEPNGKLFLKPEIEQTVLVNRSIPKFDIDKCVGCRKCVEFCEFNALVYLKNRPKVFSDICHSCGGCILVCEYEAVTEEAYPVGKVEIGTYNANQAIQVVTGVQDEGVASGVPIIQTCLDYVNQDKDVLSIIDCPPGSACSVMESITEVDFCIAVVEPTAFGFHNFQMIDELVNLLGKPMAVIINKVEEPYEPLEEFLKQKDITVLARIPYSMNLARCITEGKVAVEEDARILKQFQGILKGIEAKYKIE